MPAKKIRAQRDPMSNLAAHFPNVGPKKKLSQKEIASAYEAAVTLLDLAADYSCFGRSAVAAENAFGILIDTLQAR